LEIMLALMPGGTAHQLVVVSTRIAIYRGMLEQPLEILRQLCHDDLDAFESLFRRLQSDVYG
jgi:hypothetical protein